MMVQNIGGFNAARSIVCVETAVLPKESPEKVRFQCRTQHCVCRDSNAYTCSG